MMKYQILLYYKYVHIDDPIGFMTEHRQLCEKLNLKGRIIIANEGLNGTVEGTVEDTEEYINELLRDDRFKDTHFKRSEGTGDAFPKLSIKVRKELVSAHLGDQDIDPNQVTGKHLKPEELHEWFQTGKKFYIIDMRNDYEYEIGQFEGSVLPNLKNFRDLPKELPKLEKLKGETVLTVCTGGVRCEKASGFLIQNGFNDVYQLDGGIVSYMEKYPNQNFLGKLYVFDGRVAMGFNTDDPNHKIISKCTKCQNPSDNYVDCEYLHCKGHRHYIACHDCLEKPIHHYCSKTCYDKAIKENGLPIETEHVNIINT